MPSNDLGDQEKFPPASFRPELNKNANVNVNVNCVFDLQN